MISAVKMAPIRTVAFLRSQPFGPRTTYGNAAVLHRLLNQAQSCSPHKDLSVSSTHVPSSSPPTSTLDALSFRRSFHSSAIRHQEKKQQSQTEDSGESRSAGPESEGASESREEGKNAPPPPPHGDKTPWQVFTETLQTEFKKSKEWNESTKALASSAHQFTESESVKRARAAYEAASGAATSKTSTVLKTTGRAIGQGAAWTWETPVVKGLRKGVTVTGHGIEKITRPVRETEAYKSVKEAIDDGSSSRYGGWVEKEERRRQRQLREQNALKSGRAFHAENMEADPK
jgi:import inner membrane translocase subunit TIM44